MNFYEHHASAAQVSFNKAWANGTGYLDHACDDVALRDSMQLSTMVGTTDNHNRKIVIVKAPHVEGNVVIFQRFSSKGDDNIIVMNWADGTHQVRDYIADHLGFSLTSAITSDQAGKLIDYLTVELTINE